MRLLLLSNSRNPGGGFLEHAAPAIVEHLRGVSNVLFVPFAVVRVPHDELEASVRAWFEGIGCGLTSLHRADDPVAAVERAEAIAVSGGNTFALLDALHTHALIEPIRARVAGGAPYLGWSAGSNVACPTIRTTNDMPIVEPPSLNALGVVEFQINPHFTDATIPNHGGETRSERIEEFLARNPSSTVIGLREGTLLRVTDAVVELLGDRPARVFRAGHEPREVEPGVLTL